MKQSFFRQQENARRRTKQLVVAFHGVVFITALITTFFYIFFIKLHNPVYEDTFVAEIFFHKDNLKVFGIVYLMIFGVSWVRRFPLRQGGAYVAKMVGGREISYDTNELKEKQLINIVEEMGIASGMTLPRVFVLDGEQAINAFAAGTKINNACVAVSRGALEKLTRDELQGVVAHEFSHILNGDMALNIHLLGYLYGLTSIADAGRIIMRHSSRVRNRRNNPGPLLGFGLFVIGSLGYFFAFLLKAGISRDRERLADASAVQFTRNPEGIGGALRKIWRDQSKTMNSLRSHEISHFYLHWPQPFLSFLSTHPPLIERIKNLGMNTERNDNSQVNQSSFDPLEAVSYLVPKTEVKEEYDPLYVAYAFYLWLEPHPGMGPVDAVLAWNPKLNEAKLHHTYESLNTMSESDRFAILEKSVARLRSLNANVIKEMMGQMKALIQEDNTITFREFLYYYYLQISLRRAPVKRMNVADEKVWESVEIFADFMAKALEPKQDKLFVESVLLQLNKKSKALSYQNLSRVRESLDFMGNARPLMRPQIYKAFAETVRLSSPSNESALALRLLALVLEVINVEATRR